MLAASIEDERFYFSSFSCHLKANLFETYTHLDRSTWNVSFERIDQLDLIVSRMIDLSFLLLFFKNGVAWNRNSICDALAKLETLRKGTKFRFAILRTKTSVHVKLEYALRTAIFITQHDKAKLRDFNILNIRFNMNDILMENKHIVVVSMNYIEGGYQWQTGKNIVPLEIFKFKSKILKSFARVYRLYLSMKWNQSNVL